MADLPPAVFDLMMRESAANAASLALASVDGEFAKLIISEHGKLNQIPSPANGGSKDTLKLAVSAFSYKVGIIRQAADSVNRRPDREETVLGIVSDYCNRTGLTQKAFDDGLKVLSKVWNATRS